MKDSYDNFRKEIQTLNREEANKIIRIKKMYQLKREKVYKKAENFSKNIDYSKSSVKLVDY